MIGIERRHPAWLARRQNLALFGQDLENPIPLIPLSGILGLKQHVPLHHFLDKFQLGY